MNDYFAEYPDTGISNFLRQQATQLVLNNFLWINDRAKDIQADLPSPL
jgi:hypothetical protein